MADLPIELYKVKQIRELEQLAMTEYGIEEEVLMLRAGEAACNYMVNRFDDAERIVVFCGTGNNGGDGYILASLAAEAGLEVLVYHVGELSDLPPIAQGAAEICKNSGVDIQPIPDELDLEAIEEMDLLVDALLGIGIKGDVKEPIRSVIEVINETDIEVLSLDVPSGLDVDLGLMCGEVIIATATITFLGLKQGLYTGQAYDCCGEIAFDDLDLPEEAYEEVPITAYRIDLFDTQDLLPVRARDSHKGDFGHVLVVGGDFGMAGAVRLAGEAALRCGAGLVSVATRPEHVPAIIASRPELMCHGISDAAELQSLLKKASVVVLGPGLGDSTWSKQLYDAVLASNLPIVLDASALSLLAQKPQQRDNWVMTPHPGEAATLLQSKADTVQADRFTTVAALQNKYHGVVVLKGAGSLVLGPEALPEICEFATSALATAGSGDVLSGVIAAFCAQGMSMVKAATAGVCFHAYAGVLAAEEGERGCIASDLLPQLRNITNNLAKQSLPGFTMPDLDSLEEMLIDEEQAAIS